MDTPCPLCGSLRERAFEAAGRPFLRCAGCGLISVPVGFHLDLTEQRRRYDLHENDPDDPKYRGFLSRLTSSLVPLLEPGASGLDYGCGPGPALVAMMREAGFRMDGFDPIYAPDERLLKRRYDFVTCTEVAEHFSDPAAEWRRVARLVRPGGLLAVMTSFTDDVPDLTSWHYLRDETHVCFYARGTMEWIARTMGSEVAFPAKDVAIFGDLG